MSPGAGTTAGGTTLTLAGTGFATGMSVTVGGKACTSVTVLHPTTATCLTPAHLGGAVDVSVTTRNGTGTLPGGYTYVAPPALTAISPKSGSTDGGTWVTLTGTGFTSDLSVTIGGVTCSQVTVLSATRATCVTGKHAAGKVDVRITTVGGSATMRSAYGYVGKRR